MVANHQMELMERARASATFDTYEMTCLLYGGDEIVAKRRAAFDRVEKLVGIHDTSKLPLCYAKTDREEQYVEGLRIGKAAYDDGMKHRHDFFDHMTPRFALANASPFGLVKLMFEPAIQLNGSKEQQDKWLSLSRDGRILGTYCQTELAHGTFVRGIETTATFDPDKDEFVIHSPTLGSTKFWPASLGYSTTHAIVMARLVVSQKDHGPHMFIVPVRSPGDGKPMSGIKMGDVGLKMSYNGMDNGFASFDHVRVPRTHMLMGHAKLSREGIYSGNPQQAKLSYSTMMMVRGIIIRVSALQLAQATTIATRYSAVRDQGFGPSGIASTEMPILQYKSQHFRLLTQIAKSYAILFAWRGFDADYTSLRQQQMNLDHSSLAYVHALSAGLKAWSSQEASAGAEDARKCCGGQGFLIISGLPEIVASVTAAATFEGENYVMWQQNARYLFKCIKLAREGKKLDPRMKYLAGQVVSSPGGTATKEDLLDPEYQLSIYRLRSRNMVLAAYDALQKSERSPADAWNEHMMAIISACRAHNDYIVLESFICAVKNLSQSSQQLRGVLNDLRSLFALSTVINPFTVDAASFLSTGAVSLEEVEMIRSLVNDLLERLLPNSIALTDAWDFSDASLCSSLGMRDGNAYETTMKWISQMPINKTTWEENGGVHGGWKTWVDPILKAKL